MRSFCACLLIAVVSFEACRLTLADYQWRQRHRMPHTGSDGGDHGPRHRNGHWWRHGDDGTGNNQPPFRRRGPWWMDSSESHDDDSSEEIRRRFRDRHRQGGSPWTEVSSGNSRLHTFESGRHAGRHGPRGHMHYSDSTDDIDDWRYYSRHASRNLNPDDRPGGYTPTDGSSAGQVTGVIDLPMIQDAPATQTRVRRSPRRRFRDRHRRRRKHRRHRGSRFNFNLGPRHEPWFDIDLDFGSGVQSKRNWWEGPNVCVSSSENVEDATDIKHHFSFMSVICDGTLTTFKCTNTEFTPRGKETTTEIHECCPGFTRERDEFGCIKEVPLSDIPTLLETLELDELIKLLDASGLLGETLTSEDVEVTLFAPTNDALKTFIGLVAEMNPEIKLQRDFSSVVMVSQAINDTVLEDTRNILLGHLAAGKLTSSQLSDNRILETASPIKSIIRINTYTRPVEVMTANCIKITKADNQALNGVVHVTDDVIQPVTSNIIELIQRNPELSTFKTVLGRSAVAGELKQDGDFTVFAPSDAAFSKHRDLFKRLMDNQACLDNVLKSHILKDVVCSAVIHGHTRAMNALNNWLNLSRDADDKLFIEGAQIVTSDLMATNGVLYIIDDVIIPDQALGLTDLVTKQGFTEFTRLLESSSFKKTLHNAENVTLFIPTDEAIQSLPASMKDSLATDTEALDKLLAYHVLPEVSDCRSFHNNMELETMEGSSLRVNEYSSFPFRHNWRRTVQCAEIQGQWVEACNGLIYVIDKVLVPPVGDVIDVLAQDKRLTTLMELLKTSGVADLLQDNGPYTVFAPTNEAFDSLDRHVLRSLKENPDELKEFLLNHVTQDSICCAAVEESGWFHTQKVRTLSGELVPIRRTRGNGVLVNSAGIVQCDVTATNGVVHVIDDIIYDDSDDYSGFDDWPWDYKK